MLTRTLKTQGIFVLCLAGILILLGVSAGLHAQQAPVASANFDPSEVYLQGFLSTRAAEKLEGAGDFIGAQEKLAKAAELFATVRKFYPEWKTAMVLGRTELTQEAIARVQAQAQKQLTENRNQVAELEGGVRKPVQKIDQPRPPGVLEVDPLAARKLKEAQAEVDRLKNLVAQKEAAAARERNARRAPEAALANERQNRQQLESAVAAERQARQRLEAAITRERESLKQKQAAIQAEELRKREEALAANEDARKRLEAAERQNRQQLESVVSAERQARQRLEAAVARERESLKQKQAATYAAELRKREEALAANEEARKRLEATAAREKAARERLEAAVAKDRLARNQQETASERDAKERLRAAENTVKTLRARLLAAPMEKDMLALGRRIEALEQEREAMAMSLGQSRGAHAEAIDKITNLEAELKTMRQEHADLGQSLKTERQVANSVVAGQRRQLDVLEKQLQTKTTELAQANERIAGLINELSESREAFAELRTERDSLLLERDQMAALLKLNEAGQIQDLIEQNMALARNLREANEKVELMEQESSADKDAFTGALRDLAIAKQQINSLLQEKRQQDKRLLELKQRLENEEQALAKGEVKADPEEVVVLREIIKRQLRVQEFRRQARDQLVEAAKQLGTKDERLAKAIELFTESEIALSPEEQQLVADRQVDGEFISPFARDRASVGEATAELNRDITVFERTAEKSFLAGRLLPTRELYQMILDQHPGHTPSLCKLGVVHLRLEEPAAAADVFRRAVELEASNPYAYRMLGFSQMQLGDLPAAEQSVRRAVELAPTDAKSQSLLASLCYRLNRVGEAESHFKAAITADPMSSEPYYNLALITARAKRMDEAKIYYEQALERQAVPDPELEDLMAKP